VRDDDDDIGPSCRRFPCIRTSANASAPNAPDVRDLEPGVLEIAIVIDGRDRTKISLAAFDADSDARDVAALRCARG
jgi:hypothetical protein